MLKALPCPPCIFPIEFPCLGEHESPDWPCHLTKSGRKSCGRPCGQVLDCGNHSCKNECHTLYDANNVKVSLYCILSN